MSKPRNEAALVAPLPLAATALAVGSLALSGLIAGAITLALAETHAPSLALAAATTVGAAAGVLALSPLLLRLRTLDLALWRLARGGESALPVSAHGWPLSAVFARLDELGRRVGEEERRERQAAEYREQLLRQTAEAAAREERNRLARDLHDSIKQQLFSISVSAAAARARAEGGAGATEALGDIQRSAHEAQVEMRALLQQLRPAPLESVGLVEALRDQCEALGYRTGAAASVEVGELPGDDLLPPGAQESIFRMAQEALANIARHARAQVVTLALRREDMALLLEIRDDGQGFDAAVAPSGMGLGNLRERARALGGRVEISSAPGAGTTVRVRVPLVEPVRVSAEERERQEEVAAALVRGQRFLGYCAPAVQLAGLLILLQTPFWTVAAALVASLYSYAQAATAGAQVTLLAGKASEAALALRHQWHEWLTVALLIAALCVWYVPVVARPEWPAWQVLAGVVTGSALLAGAALAQWWLWRRDTLRYYRLLPDGRRAAEIEKRRVSCLASYGLWAFVVALGLLFGGWHPAVPPRTFTQWADAAAIALLVAWIVLNSVEYALVMRWKRRFIAGATQA